MRKRNVTGKILSAILALSMIVCALPLNVFAEEVVNTNNETVNATATQAVAQQGTVVGDLTVTGGELGKDYTYDEHATAAGIYVLTIISDTPLTISMATDVYRSTKDTIVVKSGITANLTLNEVDINMDGKNDICAFEIENGATANITFIGEDNANELYSGENRAGLEVETGATLNILTDSTHSLRCNGGGNGAGIGGGENGSRGNITILDGLVNVDSITTDIVALGGGENGGVDNINIVGGEVIARGIGANKGYTGSGGTINISGGTVKSGVDWSGTAIGSYTGTGRTTVNISGGTVTASSN